MDIDIYLALKLIGFLGAFWFLRSLTIKDWKHLAVDAAFGVVVFFGYMGAIEVALGIGFTNSPLHSGTLEVAGRIGVRDFLSEHKVIAFFAFLAWTSYFNYWTHRLSHKIPALWELHKVHHSATRMTGISQYRLHPLDDVINSYLGAILAILILPELGGNSAVNYGMFSILLNTAIHSEWRATWGIWSWIFVSPVAHQIHHSTDPAHFNSNFGFPFSIWDRLHGTYIDPLKTEAPKSFGIEGMSPTSPRTLLLEPALRFTGLARLRELSLARPASLVVRDDDALREGQLYR